MRLPGLRQLSGAVYRWVARNRDAYPAEPRRALSMVVETATLVELGGELIERDHIAAQQSLPPSGSMAPTRATTPTMRAGIASVVRSAVVKAPIGSAS
jgi:hypothetical protein